MSVIVCKIFFCFFMSLLAGWIVENIDPLAGIYFPILKKRRGANEKVFRHKFWPQWKDWKSSYQVRQSLALFCYLVALILEWNFVTGFIVIKLVKKVKFEGASSVLEAKDCLQRQPWTKYLRKTLVFMSNSALWTSFIFYFSTIFC